MKRFVHGLAWAGALAGLLLCVPEHAAGQQDALEVRRQFNLVAARIDSLVRAMAASDEKAIGTEKLPARGDRVRLPAGTELVLIFWADDEAKVWLNDYYVGETRLTPVELSVPSLYLRGTNRLRARCWDTDWVESGFLCGLYLRGAGGVLHPVVVSNGAWQGAEGPADEIAYAHSLPDVPGAEVIWGSKVFGTVELEVRFDAGSVQRAVDRAAAGIAPAPQRAMRYHDFIQAMALLETERERLGTELASYEARSAIIPGYHGAGRQSQSLTLGKAAPLEEKVSLEVSEDVRTWAEELPEEQRAMVYPERRALKGEAAATAEMLAEAGLSGSGERTRTYTPPPERNRTDPGREDGRGGRASGGAGEGEGERGGNAWGGGGGGGRASRLGLLVPTMVLAAYVVYVLTHWKKLGESA